MRNENRGEYVITNEERIRRSFSVQGFMSTLGAELTAVAQGSVEIRLPFSPSLAQQNGYLHAGAISAVLDSACGYAALTMAADDKGGSHCGVKDELAGARRR
jgi:acyl-coenzyme A thioesterase PaaI-like protein